MHAGDYTMLEYCMSPNYLRPTRPIKRMKHSMQDDRALLEVCTERAADLPDKAAAQLPLSRWPDHAKPITPPETG